MENGEMRKKSLKLSKVQDFSDNFDFILVWALGYYMNMWSTFKNEHIYCIRFKFWTLQGV